MRAAAIAAAAHGAAAGPHIVFVLMDDVGWNDVGYANPAVRTPSIDGLAAQSLRLDRMYAVRECAPTRTSFMTGRYPYHYGYYANPPDTGGIPLTFTVLPQLFKGVGYATHALGKWHCGFMYKEMTPTFRGFDSFLGYWHWGEEHFDHIFPPWYKGDSIPGGAKCRGVDLSRGTPGEVHTVLDAYDGVYGSHLFTGEAVRIIETHDVSQGLFMYLAYQNNHDPYQVPNRYSAMYPDEAEEKRRIFMGMLSAMDEGIGNVSAALRRTGLWDSTLLVVQSDNGGELPFEHPINASSVNTDLSGGAGNNFPLRGGKFTIWEGGVRTRGFIGGGHLPAVLRGHVWDGLAHICDWYPTLAEAAGAAVPADTGPAPPDGVSLWPALLRRGASPRRDVVHYPLNRWWNGSCGGYNGDGPSLYQVSCGAALTRWPHKLIVGFGGDNRTVPLPGTAGPPAPGPGTNCTASPCLFDLSADPGESRDIAAASPGLVAELTAALRAYGASGAEPQAGNETQLLGACDVVERTGAWLPWRSPAGALLPPA